jgi:hypothetical protein
MTNLAAPIASGGAAPAPLLLTAAQVASPTVVQTMPSSAASGSLPSAAEMSALAKKYETCLALPVPQRVTTNTNGDVTAVSATCNYAPATWLSNARNWAQDVGQYALTLDYLTGAKVGIPTLAAVFPAANLTVTNEFKHPVCNASTCVVMNIPMTSASGKPLSSNWVLGKVNGSWDYVGNQRPYRMFVEQRLNRKVAMNTALEASSSTNYFAQSRFESSIRVTFDLSEGSTSLVRAVRWTGPGLPTAGLVTHRSSRCGTDDRMPITNQEGLLTVNNSVSTQTWNGAGGIDFILSTSKLDGTAFPSTVRPVPTSAWATTAAPANQDVSAAEFTGAIPAYSMYKGEIFYFANTTNVADEVVWVRTDSPFELAADGVNKSWPVLDSAFATNYLTPTGANAGTIIQSAGAAAHAMSWVNPSGGYVGSSYLFSQNTLNLTNGVDAASNYVLRTRLDFRPTALGNTSALGAGFANVYSGTSLSSSTATSGINPNPRCSAANVADLVALSTTNGAYREAGLSFRSANRKLYNAIHFWSN